MSDGGIALSPARQHHEKRVANTKRIHGAVSAPRYRGSGRHRGHQAWLWKKTRAPMCAALSRQKTLNSRGAAIKRRGENAAKKIAPVKICCADACSGSGR